MDPLRDSKVSVTLNEDIPTELYFAWQAATFLIDKSNDYERKLMMAESALRPSGQNLYAHHRESRGEFITLRWLLQALDGHSFVSRLGS